MSARVNLLPHEVADKNRAARQRTAAAGAGAGLLVLLAAAYLFQANRVGNAREELAEQEAEVARLQAELADLQEFEALAARREAGAQLLAAALGDEVSFAGVLQDLAAVYPAGAQLESLSVSLTETEEVPLGALRPALGVATASGATLQGHAPGLERILLELDKVAAFSNVFFSNSTRGEDDVSAFSLEFDLGPEALTLRYADGLPEELR